MLIKEYHIPLPITVEEYRIAQRFTIAKKNSQRSNGANSRIEILTNEPYIEDKGGKVGQYTHKLYHLGSYMPTWIQSILPKDSLICEEKTWNAYPHGINKYKSPILNEFSIEMETYHFDGIAQTENLFELTEWESRNRTVDVIDIVKDRDLTQYDDGEKNDPRKYVSQKTGRGPLSDDWIARYRSSIQETDHPKGLTMVQAYKLVKVKCEYWGMQSILEKFIHDFLRKQLVDGYLHTWTKQDEWYGLTMEDIDKIEDDTEHYLRNLDFDDECISTN